MKFENYPYLQPNNVFGNVNIQVLKKICQIQEKSIKSKISTKKIGIVFDDISGVNFLGKDKNFFKDFFSTARQRNILLIFSCHFITDILPNHRSQFQNIFILTSSGDTEILRKICNTNLQINEFEKIVNTISKTQFSTLWFSKICYKKFDYLIVRRNKIKPWRIINEISDTKD
jgi:hypothetical protein